jgi:uncharacterized protein
LLTPTPLEEILHSLGKVYATVRESSGIVFGLDREDREKHANTYTFYLKYTGPLPAGNDVKVDITLRERLVYPLQKQAILRGYEEFEDIPLDRWLQTYSLDEIVAEKTIALADRARNEPRDRYDLWYLTSHQAVDLAPLGEAVRQKLEFRGREYRGIQTAILHKEARLSSGPTISSQSVWDVECSSSDRECRGARG